MTKEIVKTVGVMAGGVVLGNGITGLAKWGYKKFIARKENSKK